MKAILLNFLIICLVNSISLLSKPLEIGDTYPLPPFNDQFDKPAEVSSETQLLIFVAEMEPSKVVHEVLKNETSSTMKQKKIYFLSDIHRMPSLITRFIALPKMRDYSYPVALIREEGISNDLPREKGKISLFFLNSKKIQKIQFLSKIEELQNSINSLK